MLRIYILVPPFSNLNRTGNVNQCQYHYRQNFLLVLLLIFYKIRHCLHNCDPPLNTFRAAQVAALHHVIAFNFQDQVQTYIRKEQYCLGQLCFCLSFTVYKKLLNVEQVLKTQTHFGYVVNLRLY